MDIEIKVPSLGESETEATLISWLKQEGDDVAVDDVLAEIESDKITMEITALDSGVLKQIIKQADSTVEPGEVIAIVDDSIKPATVKTDAGQQEMPAAPAPETRAEKAPAPAARAEKAPAGKAKVTPSSPAEAEPAVGTKQAEKPAPTSDSERSEQRVPMSGLRRRIATRLKEAQNTAAMLTTFNEVNLQAVMDLRSRYGAAFQEQHGVKLGFMSFFVRAVCQGLTKHPALNAFIDGDEIAYHNYVDVGIAVSTDKGLVVPVLRDAHLLGLADIEKGIADLAGRARSGGLMPDDLKGGTFSITNGGIYGSMLSTPILNPPQSGILGMHTIQQRPVAENNSVVIRPMMYLALSYDHRLIDGSEAVRFLVTVKETLEYPGSLTLEL
ncbi:dihydrolipoyllysine-residue succinyltransferase [Mariprofundus ferrooxydans]|uniref:Dihydrolipoyllysine-residue succinyltransferase n=1 Tax=Mariprofundus ferrooxydans PV-1 TaxID=314345 RepID=Q0F239_9PROT|nr:dihydrolipoyllysine-residue succinyltransferase [Mariprofundus ferrooxydans]EAU55711.1 dihydrolipoamide acetyltransferase [Mariprofundus ferrooxydans PV-1]KON47874.1 dihydrolipoamide succinyltransferase [Mariprofundus ferrooxydans]